jgi:hypothetical protein
LEDVVQPSWANDDIVCEGVPLKLRLDSFSGRAIPLVVSVFRGSVFRNVVVLLMFMHLGSTGGGCVEEQVPVIKMPRLI